MISNFSKTRTRNKDGTFTKLVSPSGFDLKKYRMTYRVLNRDELVQKAVDWGKKNKEKRKVIRDRWVQKNRDKVNFLKRNYMYRRKRCLKLLSLNGVNPSRIEIENLYSKYAHKCAYCCVKKADTIDHVVSLVRGGLNDISNLLPACRSCNSSKGAKLLSEWRPLLKI